MRQTTLICDKCGDVILDHASVLSITAAGELKPAIDRIDLCGECSARLLEWIRSRVAALATR